MDGYVVTCLAKLVTTSGENAIIVCLSNVSDIYNAITRYLVLADSRREIIIKDTHEFI